MNEGGGIRAGLRDETAEVYQPLAESTRSQTRAARGIPC